MRMPRAAGVLVLGVALAGCGAAQNASVTVGRAGGGAAGGPDATVVSGPVAGPPLTPLQRRTTGSVTLRTFTTPAGTTMGCGGSGECIPDWCQPTQTVVVELSTPVMAAVLDSEVIGLGPDSSLSVLGTYGGGPYGGGVYAASSGGAAYSSSLTVSPVSGPVPSTVPGPDQPAVAGTAEGDPVQVLAVRVGPTVAKVTMRTADGEDSTKPVHGLAVLAVDGNASSGELTAADADGHTVATVSLPTAPTQATAACAPKPPSLPAPGMQPADVAAAQKAVQQAYTLAFTAVPNRPPYASLALVEGGDGLHATLDKLRQNFAIAAASSTVSVGQIVFTGPTSAALFFTVTYQQGAAYGTQIGHAVLEGGSWLVSRDTYCALMAFGGATCPAS